MRYIVVTSSQARKFGYTGPARQYVIVDLMERNWIVYYNDREELERRAKLYNVGQRRADFEVVGGTGYSWYDLAQLRLRKRGKAA